MRIFLNARDNTQTRYTGPALAGAVPNARLRRGALLSSGVMTLPCSVNRATTCWWRRFSKTTTVYAYQNRRQIIEVDMYTRISAVFFLEGRGTCVL